MTIIKQLGEEDYADAMAMVWRVFLKFNAPTYSADGIYNFKKFLTDETLFDLFCRREYIIFALYEEGTLCGVISLRNGCHISLLFVREEYQRTGVATKLFRHLCSYCREINDAERITVNSSPYAVDFYRHLGFNATDLPKTSDGITYTPMIYDLYPPENQ